jgi:hypothetical protein
MDARICVERGLGGIVIVTPVAMEVWMSSWWNDRGHIESGRGPRASVCCARSLRPIGGSGRRDWGSAWLTVLPEGYTCPSGGVKVSHGGRALSMTPRGARRGGGMSPGVPISPETSPQGSGRMEFVVRTTSD